MLRRILYNQHLSGGGGGGGAPTVVSAPAADSPLQQAKKEVNPVGPKPQMSKPTPESVKKQMFSIDDFEVEQLPTQADNTEKKSETVEKTEKKETVVDPVDGNDPVDETEKVAEKLVVEEKKEELPKWLKKPGGEKKEEAGAKTATQPVTPPGKITRDYVGHTADEIAVFKKMSDEAYQFTKKLLNENKELKGAEKGQFFQNENAYQLSPEYQGLQQDSYYYRLETEHWRQQLIAMSSGKQWKALTGYDAKTGQPIYSQEMQPSADAEIRVQQALLQCTNAEQQARQKMSEFPTQYKNHVAQDLVAIDNECKKQFAWEGKPEYLDYVIETTEGEKSIKGIREDFSGLFPSYLRSHPAVRVAGNMMVALMIARAENNELKSQQQTRQTIAGEKELVEPNPQNRPNKKQQKAVHGITEFVDDLNL